MNQNDIIKELLDVLMNQLSILHDERQDLLDEFMKNIKDSDKHTNMTLGAYIDYIHNTLDSDPLQVKANIKKPTEPESEQLEFNDLVSIREFINIHKKYFKQNYKHLPSAVNSIYGILSGHRKRKYKGFYEMTKRNGKGPPQFVFCEKEMRDYIGL